MTHRVVGDGIAGRVAGWLVMASFAVIFLFPDIDRMAVSALDFAFCGLALWSGRNSSDDRTRAWERIEIATWLVISPWVLGFDKVSVTTINALACGVVIFIVSASVVGRAEQPVRLPRRH